MTAADRATAARSPSLRRQALLAFIVPLLACTVIALGITAVVVVRTIDALRDVEMARNAEVLALLLRHEAGESDNVGVVQEPLITLPASGADKPMQFGAWTDTVSVIRSAAMPLHAPPGVSGYRNVSLDGERWRVYARVRDDFPSAIAVAEPLRLRRTVALWVVLALSLPWTLLTVIVALIGSRKLRAAVAPIEAVSAELDARHAGDLTRLDPASAPVEVRPLVRALDGLLARLADSIEREREFTDNAAHELRTPLAVLKARAQIVERSLRDDPERAAAAADFVAAVDRTVQVIDQMFELVRVIGGQDEAETFDLGLLAADVAREMVPMALEQGIDVVAELPPGGLIAGNPDAVEIAVRNMLGNAIKFTPAGGTIELGIAVADKTVGLTIADDGPGIAPGEEERIFERFRRDRARSQGTGLGLAIVRRVMNDHGGTARAERREPHGLVLRLEFPRAG